ncbi:hypothetical protein NK6_5609 [Bradyrhizobium diazoefficiens]|uniref:Transposase n=1 Tax=Bradyrhizobium diazoefficiens TaxID=1355477 RepID=A0A0E4BS27_9BRAD|nr:hypothetical protein NK6_5609 [Bradyrhizobium diazoefficiens]
MPLRRKKLRPDLEKVYGFRRFEAGFPAIFRNFAVRIPHIRQGLSSEQFCVFAVAKPDRRHAQA